MITDEVKELLSCEKSVISALIVNDIIGGTIMKYKDYYYNLVDNEIVDLTKEDIDYNNSEEIKREELLSNTELKEEYKKGLGKIREYILDKDFEEIDSKESLNKYKDYLNKYYLFCDFEIDEYSIDDNYEYTRIDLAGQNTGLIIDIKHNLETDKYEYSYSSEIPLPLEFLKAVFDTAREYKDNFVLEKLLTNAYVRI